MEECNKNTAIIEMHGYGI